MTLAQLKSHVEQLLSQGVDPSKPVVFRSDSSEKGRMASIDYSVMSTDQTKVVFAEEWI